MSNRLVRFAAIGVLAGMVTLPALSAQEKAKGNVQGTVVDVSQDKSTITIRTGTATRLVTYDSKTRFLYGHSKEAKNGSIAQVKGSFYISCAVTDGKTLVASECVYREEK